MVQDGRARRLLSTHRSDLEKEVELLSSTRLTKAYALHRARVHHSLRTYSEDPDTLSLETQIRDASQALSAQILTEAFAALDERTPCLVVEGRTYFYQDSPLKRVMTTFGSIVYHRSRYRHRNRPSYFPADDKVGLLEGDWTPLAVRVALFELALGLPRECVKSFQQRGGMCPSVSSLIRLSEAAGRVWDTIAASAYATLRQQEEIPRDASILTIQIDGVMVPMAPTNTGQHGPRKIEWREAACGMMTLSTAGSDLLRTIRHGRMPESGKLSLKHLIADEVAHLHAQKPDLRLVAVANGA